MVELCVIFLRFTSIFTDQMQNFYFKKHVGPRLFWARFLRYIYLIQIYKLCWKFFKSADPRSILTLSKEFQLKVWAKTSLTIVAHWGTVTVPVFWPITWVSSSQHSGRSLLWTRLSLASSSPLAGNKTSGVLHMKKNVVAKTHIYYLDVR